MYKTKPRLDPFNQQPFLPPKQSQDAFWDEDDVRPFRLSVPNHFRNTNTHKQSHNDQWQNQTQQYENYRPANKQTKQPQRQAQYRQKRDNSYMYDRPYSTLAGYFAQKIYTNWIEKELNFSMSKLSFLVLIIGLFFLSSLLFITGFLMAVNVYNIGAPQIPSQLATTTGISIAGPNIPNIPSLSMPTVNMPQIASPAYVQAPTTNMQPAAMPGTQMTNTAQITSSASADTIRMPTVYAPLPTQALPPLPMPQNGTQYAPQQTLMPQQQIQQPALQPIQQAIAHQPQQVVQQQTIPAQQYQQMQQQGMPIQQPHYPPQPVQYAQQPYPSYQNYVQPNYQPQH